ncbi:ferredoxin-thioredoxin reductase catalytic domain-containing protein [Staphylococcus aureus]
MSLGVKPVNWNRCPCKPTQKSHHSFCMIFVSIISRI